MILIVRNVMRMYLTSKSAVASLSHVITISLPPPAGISSTVTPFITGPVVVTSSVSHRDAIGSDTTGLSGVGITPDTGLLRKTCLGGIYYIKGLTR